MTLYETLLSDLGRQYHYGGRASKKPDLPGLFLYLFSPRFMPVVIFRLSHFCYRMKLAPLAKLFSLMNFVLFGLEIAVRCEIGGGLYLPHTQGTVLGAFRVGNNATIYHNVTLGAREVDLGYSEAGRPVLGDNVIVGAGAKVLGGVKVGNEARIGANAVVVADVPAGSTAVGVPAKLI